MLRLLTEGNRAVLADILGSNCDLSESTFSLQAQLVIVVKHGLNGRMQDLVRFLKITFTCIIGRVRTIDIVVLTGAYW